MDKFGSRNRRGRGGWLLAILIARLSVAISATPAYSDQSEQYDLKIDPQPLSGALQQLAKQTGIQVIFFSKITDNLQAAPLQGRYTAAAALERLLGNSHLTFHEVNAHTVEIRPQSDTRLLVSGSGPGVADDAQQPQPAPESASPLEEVIVARFVGADARSAMKQDVRVLDTPVSVDDYSSSFMKAIETTNVANLYSYMTGVQRGGATGYDLSIRGFKTTQTDKNALLVDGLPGVAGRYGSPPTAGTDHIEVVKGPASVLYGQGQPGGFVNLITKKPSTVASASVDVIGQGYDGAGVSLGHRPGITADADFTGPINASQTLLYRLVLEDVHRDSFRGSSYEHSSYIAPSLTWLLATNTSATLAVEVRHREAGYDNFLVAPNKDAHLIAAPTIVYQSPDDIQPERGTAVTLSLDHALTPEVNWHTAARTVSGSDDAVGYDTAGVFQLPATTKVPVLPSEWVVQRRARQQHNDRSYSFIDSNLTLPATTGSVGHKLLVGVNGGVDTTDFNRIQFFNGPNTGALARPGVGSINVDVYNPNFSFAPPLSAFGPGPVNERYTRTATYAAYLSDLMTLTEHWKVNAGVRYTGEQLYAAERKTSPLTTNRITANKLLPTGGLLYEPWKSWTLYADYSTSFVPVAATAQDVNGNYTFNPESAHQVELGTKLDLGSQLSATLAAFDIHRQNVLEPILCPASVGGLCSQQVGAERSKGGELEVNAHLMSGWQALLGYSYTDAIIDRSNSNPSAPLAGDRLTNSSLNSLHLWSRYDVGSGPLKNFGVGVGAFYVSSHAGTLPSANDRRLLLLPAYTVVDLAVYYALFERYDFTLRVSNLFDKIYYEGVNSTTNELGVVPGSPRYIQLSLHVPLY